MNMQQVHELFSKAVAHQNRKEYDPALRLFDKILIEAPTFVPAWNQRASLLAALNCQFDAITNYTLAINLNDKDAGLYSNRGVSFLALGYYDKALEDFHTCLKMNPTIAETYNNVGITLRRTCQLEESIGYFRNAIKYRPDYADAHLGLGMSLLELQRFDEGWKEFEWRWKTGQMTPRPLPFPTWEGEHCPDKTLLLMGEQGFGDVLQFVRYAEAVKERFGGKIIAEVRLPMARLLAKVPGIDKVIVMGEKLPIDEIAYSIHMMSVPAIVGTEKGFMGPYLKPDPQVSAYWAKLFTKIPDGVRVGLCWAGHNREENATASAIDARRSLTLSQFAPMASIKGITWISTQLGAPAQQIKQPPAGMSIIDVTKELDDFFDTSAMVDNLDLVITVDTAMVHLAAGQGKPTWMLSRFDGCWRWFGDRPDSPWYPSLTQYRQKKDGDWEPVIEAMTRDLQRFVVNKRKQAA